MRTVLILPIIFLAGCADQFESGAKQWMRHERMSETLLEMQIERAAEICAKRCGGHAALIAGQSGELDQHYRCAAPPQ